MRLIDADKLPNIYTATHQEMIMAFEEAPTVEAIPVEFIKSEIKENKGFYNSNLRRLLDLWAERKEE